MSCLVNLFNIISSNHLFSNFMNFEAHNFSQQCLFLIIEFTLSDANDNRPIFTQLSYSALINEASPVGHNIITVTANDLDSGKNGLVSYSIASGDRHKQFRIDSESGIIQVASALDREMISSYVLEILAKDAGQPNHQEAKVLVNIDIADANDNPPIFPEGNYTAYLQEDKPLDHVVHKFTVTDADEIPNGSPFTFDIRAGNEGNAFKIVQDGSLRTAAKFDHKLKKKYVLQIRVFDNGTPPLFSDSFITINIIEESQYPPDVQPLEIGILSYQDEFPGAAIGQIKAKDRDPYDSLAYSLVPHSANRQSHLFEIDHNSGRIFAVQGLDVGAYHLNVSVTDGKFTSYSSVLVTVNAITDKMLDNAVILRFANVKPKEFYNLFAKSLKKLLKNVLKVKTSDVDFLSVQMKAKSSRSKRDLRDSTEMLELLIAVRKNSKKEYVSREKVMFLLQKSKFKTYSAKLGLDLVDIVDLPCEDNECGSNGSCEKVILMGEEVGGVTATTSEDGSTFIAPNFEMVKMCNCQEGYAGESCEVILNECARKPCPTFKECVPDSSFQGYQCHCPPGLTGTLCNVNITSCASSKCNIVNPMTFGGKSYAQYRILKSLERHMVMSLGFKTLHATGSIMYAVGMIDYSVLEIVNGKLRYRFNFGSGEGLVTLNELVNDGEWHEVRLERHGNQAKIILDQGSYEEHGSAPGVNDVLNVNDGIVYFGAEVVVHHTPTNGEDINKGFTGCLDDIRLDGTALPLHLHGSSQVAKLQRFNNVEFKCGELSPPGACGAHPCQNGGSCQEHGESYLCNCLARFTGTHCEYDLDPCASNPCLHGSRCVNLKNDYHCECPPKLSGKRCHYGQFCNPNPCRNGGLCEEGLDGAICKCRGFTGKHCTIDINECLHQNPCQNGGTCINSNGGFHCICLPNTNGPYCNELYDASNPGRNGEDFTLSLPEVVGIIASLFLIVFVVIVVVLCIKCTGKKKSRCSASYHIQNDFDKQESVRFSHHLRPGEEGVFPKRDQKLNNLELAAQERPLLSPPRPVSCIGPNQATQQQQETAFTYVDTVRSYGSAADELESLPRISHDYIQNIKKPMAAVAPSVSNASQAAAGHDNSDRNLMGNYFHPDKNKIDSHFNNHNKLRVNLPPTADSPALKGATSLSSLQTSGAEDTSQRYFWDSFDLNDGAAGGHPTTALAGASVMPRLSMVPENPKSGTETNTSTLPPPGKPVDPSRDIETLNEDDHATDADVISTADTEDEPQLGSVYPKQPITKSFEELLALNDDINFADAEEEDGATAVRDFHLNNYLPTYNISETDTDEQTPMLGRMNRFLPIKSPAAGSKVSKSSNDMDTSSELNASISVLPEEEIGTATNGVQRGINQSDLDNVCDIEDSEDETPTVEVKPMPPLNSRVTRV